MRHPALLLLLLAATAVAAPVPIFDGKSLDGWEGDAKLWRVEEGEIRGGSLTEQVTHNDFLATVKSYSNFDLRVKIKLSGTEGFINSGVQIRSLRVSGSPEMSGYQVDYGKGWYGKLYDESRRNKVVAESADMNAATAAIKEGDWNEYRIRAHGARIQSWINGVPALDYTEPEHIPQDGHIGIQIHGGGKALVQVKEVTIEVLPALPDAPTWEELGGIEGVKAKLAPPKKGADAAPPVKRDIDYNAVATDAKTPEQERALFKLPDGFEAQLVAAEDPANGIGKFVPIAFDQRGALWTTTALEYPVDGNENPAAADALYASRAKDKVLVYDRDPKSPNGYASKPRVFADGLAIPLGVLPYKNGCYVQHGHDIAFLEDTDADGRADKRTVILIGFGVQDSHLFPHQFMRAPGGWIWMAQGAFNYSKVRRPDEPAEKAVQFDQTRMAKFRPDGSGFDITSNGPCNIWGLVLNGEGEAFIQEANDFGYPVMPFHEYANYPGCSDRQWKSYAPEFPGTAPDFKMGGTGLSGLALLDEGWARLLDAAGAQKNLSSRAERSGVEGPQISAGSGGAEQKRESPQSSAPPPPAKDGGSSTPLRSAQNDSEKEVRGSSQTVLVANPITNRIQAIKMHRDGPYWKLDKPVDFLVSEDPWFRPVAITIGPDGCLYIVDWYNKIISHNEVPRNHPDRDKTRGRIWRVKAKAQKPLDVPDFTKLSGDELIAKLGGDSLAQSHLAWQTLANNLALNDGKQRSDLNAVDAELLAIAKDTTQSTARRIQALWANQECIFGNTRIDLLSELLRDQNPAVRRELLRMDTPFQELLKEPEDLLAPLTNDSDPQVKSEVIRSIAARIEMDAQGLLAADLHEVTRGVLEKRIAAKIGFVLQLALAPFPEPVAPSTRNGKPIKVREAYDREFERYLVRMFLERHPDAVAKFLDSDGAKPLPVEARLLASLALEPKASAARVAKLLPRLQRAPGQEEVLRLAEFPDEPGAGEALKAILQAPATRTATLEALLSVRTKLDAAKLAPLLGDAAAALLASHDAASNELGVRLAAGFKLANAESALVALVRSADLQSARPAVVPTAAETPVGTTGGRTGYKPVLLALQALSEIGSAQTDLFAKLAETAAEPALRDEALAALAASKAADAPRRTLALYPKLAPAQRRVALDKLSTTKAGASAVVAAVSAGTLPKTDLDAAALDRLLAVLGEGDPALAKLLGEMSAFFRPVLMLDGSDDAWAETGVTLDGPLTVETWVRLDPQARKIGNADGILGAPGQLDINFYDGKLRVYCFPPLGDVAVAKKAITPGLWTHVAATRDAAGIWRLYLDGELDATASKPAPGKIENARIAWTGAGGGTRGAFAEFRIWNRERTANEIRTNFDRALGAQGGAASALHSAAERQPGGEPAARTAAGTPPLPVFASAGGWGKPHSGAKVAKTSDLPPVLTADQAAQLDTKFAKYTALAAQPGDIERGKQAALVCAACHLLGTSGGNIGPNLSGVGAMGVEAILRNILTPNAAMESAYRIYRVEQRDGSVLDAFFVSEDKDAVVIRLPGAADQRLAKRDIVRTQFLRRSLMPEGLLDGMSDQQVSDLFAYLKSLK